MANLGINDKLERDLRENRDACQIHLEEWIKQAIEKGVLLCMCFGRKAVCMVVNSYIFLDRVCP